ncbi:GatB/YqeY domain-containing protein [Allobranchiibius sp. CTAmp26]|uniref:GatB/YqeY domain-containing protein n=1 Tax=Allobranchiibius sp. CTAmp26 TaxID=2815214 RepID=UPI001AA15C4F|nr:GatB/YqeY domain-containing protein [Allobranchiibius sp. CTAmp26]MBO1753765.1 GatB/YqeY domain-containing protein [Allobranchiibius sp. CTAmp26]
MSLKDTLQTDLTAAMRAKDTVRTQTLRMALAAVRTSEVSGDAKHELTDDEVLACVTKEAKKRREAATAYDDAGRPELADAERAELAVLEHYLPAQLSDEELTTMIQQAISSTGASGMGGMGQVMKVLQPQIAGRADGGKVAAAVREALSAG